VDMVTVGYGVPSLKFRVTDRGNTGCVASTGEGAGMSKTLSEKKLAQLIRKNEQKVVTISRKAKRRDIIKNGGRF